jgi:adenylate kinase family enzyme
MNIRKPGRPKRARARPQMAQPYVSPVFPASSPEGRATTNSNKIRNVFVELMSRIEAERGRANLIFPDQIVFVIGPPASGKTTLGKILSDQLGFVNDQIPMRDICRKIITENGGKLDVDKILEELVTVLLKAGENGGVVVDDFLSITCARAVPFLYFYLRDLQNLYGREPIKFKFCVLYSTLQTSLQRQRLKQDDYNEFECTKLFEKFYIRTHQVIELVRLFFGFNIVDSNGSLTQTQILLLREIRDDENGKLNENASLRDALSNLPTITPKMQKQIYRQQMRKIAASTTPQWTKGFNYGWSPGSASTPLNSNAVVFTPSSKFFKKSYLLKKMEGLENSVNAITDELEIQILTTSVNKILQVPQVTPFGKRSGPNLAKFEANTKINKSNYKLQYYVKGQPTFLYWTDTGLCYFIDHKNQALEIASNAYRNSSIGEAFIEGILCKNEYGEIIFVVNDLCHFRSKSHRCANLAERSEMAIELMEDLGVPDGPIKFAINPLQDITKENLKTRFKDVVLDGCSVPAMGYMFVPKKSKFHFTKKTPAYKWIDGNQDYINRTKLIKNVIR